MSLYFSIPMPHAPQNLRFCGTPNFTMLGGNEFRLRKSPPAAPILRAIRRAPLRGVLVRHYTSICSITKASMTSPSLMSLYFSIPMPHAPQNLRFCGTPNFTMLGGNEFRLRKSPPAAPILRAIRRAPLRGVLVRHYTSICSITKASITSPSLISLYFSIPMPHS